ncbi:hypothetical protein F0562_028283 [Nyssa sinensis]|uniref:Uncharacterized protein n=1 Tax=Nyssa sinensis TaxID=561372 RepID=A0A5J5B600_9ASTE|nr:hypothetical protein F0562_028283 [Nyssa sinensis]
MQPSGDGGGGGGELSRGLARFRSAPATWLETLLESEEEDDSLKPTQCLTQVHPTNSGTPTTGNSASSYVSAADPGLFDASGGASGLGFLRQNSSPAELLAQISSGSDGYFSNFGIPANYDYLSSTINVSPSSKQPREVDSEAPISQIFISVEGRAWWNEWFVGC